MRAKRMVRGLTGVVLVVAAWCFAQGGAGGQQASAAQEKKAKNPEEGKTGTTVGTLVKKADNAIEVKGDGEERARRFVPRWRGGAPAQGGGPDREVLKAFAELKVGSRVEVEWVFEERLRALKVKTLRPPPGDRGEKK